MRTGILKILAITALLGCFLLPVDYVSIVDRLFVAAESLFHFIAFALCYVLLISLLPSLSVMGLMMMGGTLFLVLGGVEIIQPFAGRDREWLDIVYGMGGVGCGFCMIMARRSLRGLRLVWVVGSLLLVAGATVPFMLMVWDHYQAGKNFPLLASFESPMETGRWTAQGCRIKRSREHVLHGRYALQVIPQEGNVYPGVFMTDFPRDWRQLQALCFDVYLEGANNAVIWLRVDDRKDPVEYGERFQKPMELIPGWNAICVKRDELGTTSNGRFMDMTRIETWGLFFDRESQERSFSLDSVRLIIE